MVHGLCLQKDDRRKDGKNNFEEFFWQNKIKDPLKNDVKN